MILRFRVNFVRCADSMVGCVLFFRIRAAY